MRGWGEILGSKIKAGVQGRGTVKSPRDCERQRESGVREREGQDVGLRGPVEVTGGVG